MKNLNSEDGTMSSIQNKKPRFVSGERIFRQYERCEQVTCHVLYPLGIDNTKIYIYLTHSKNFNFF